MGCTRDVLNPHGSDETQELKAKLLAENTFISHTVQMKRNLFKVIVVTPMFFISHTVQMKLSLWLQSFVKLPSLYPTRFRWNLKEDLAYLFGGSALYPTRFRWNKKFSQTIFNRRLGFISHTVQMKRN